MPQRELSLVDCLRQYDPTFAQTARVHRVVIHTDEDDSYDTTVTPNDLNLQLPSLEDMAYMRNRRLYMGRRRREIRRDESLLLLNNTIRNEERELTEKINELNRKWNDVVRTSWKDNDDRLCLRREYTRVRDRLARHRRTLNRRLDSIIGEEPIEHEV